MRRSRTVKLWPTPAVVGLGKFMVNFEVAAATTEMPDCVPLIEPSEAVIEREPAVLSVPLTMNTPASPAVNVWLVGEKAACGSSLVNVTEPR